MRIGRVRLAALVTGGLLAAAPAARADVRIGGFSMFANGAPLPSHTYTGPCPVALEFHFGVISTMPAMATYNFSRGDGGRGPAQQVQLPPGRSIPLQYDWRLGAATPAFANYQSFVRMDIAAPNAVAGQIPFTLHCR